MMERIVKFLPAYDSRANGRGIHGMEIRFILKGERGAVQFVMYTPFHLPSVDKSGWPEFMREPMAADLGCHAYEAQYEGQCSQENCPYLDGQPCFYDGSGLAAEEPMRILIAEGDEALWKFLNGYYADRFRREE